MKLSEYRSIVAQLLDDQSNARWTVGSTTFDRTKEIDYAIELSLDKCLSAYAANGGGLLDEEAELSSDASGILDMSSYRPAFISAVLLKIGEVYYPLEATRAREYELASTGVKTLKVRYIRTFDLDSVADTATVAYGASGETFPLFDHWICVTAANYLATKTGEVNQLLIAQQDELRREVLDRGPIPTTYTLGGRRNGLASWYRKHYKFTYLPNKIIVSQRTLWH